jgi:hypothetical protein
MKTLITKVVIAASIVTASLAPMSASALGSANFAISAGSATVGNNLTVNISENGSAVNVVTTKLTFDTSKLQLLNVSCGFGSTQQENNGVTCYTSGGTTVDATTAAVATFKAVAPGSASISLADSSLIASGGNDIWTHATTSTTINVTNPAPTPPPTTPPAGNTGTANAGTPNPGSSTSTSSKTTTATGSPVTTGVSTNSNVTPTPTSQTTALGNQNTTVTKKAAPVHEKHIRSHYSAAVITSWIVLAALVVAGVYLFILQRRGNLPAFITKTIAKLK